MRGGSIIMKNKKPQFENSYYDYEGMPKTSNHSYTQKDLYEGMQQNPNYPYTQNERYEGMQQNPNYPYTQNERYDGMQQNPNYPYTQNERYDGMQQNPNYPYTQKDLYEGMQQTPNYSYIKQELYEGIKEIPDYPYTEKEYRRKRRAPRRKLSFFSVFLCIVLSLTAGFLGSLGALCIAGAQKDKVEQTTEDVLCKDPENEILRPDPNPSIYGSAGEDAFAVSGVVNKVQDAVVIIEGTILDTSPLGQPITSTTIGSGVIISSAGYILTCHHLVDGADSVNVTLRNNKTYSAVLVGSDEISDLAVLKISADEPLTHVVQGHSADLVAGEQVVAIGNPLGMPGGTVTVGYISATEREIEMSDGSKITLIQTDTVMNSGNSGGGLFNLAGELIGVFNAKYSASGVEGLAFAIPIDSAYSVQLDLMQYGYVRGVIDHGLMLLDVTEENLAQYHNFYGIEEIGVYVVESEYATELKIIDRIVSVNGIEVKTVADFKKLLVDCKVGDTITIVADRKGETVMCDLVLQEYVPDRIKDLLQ
ncbi:MAG: trypsin-like serine protease [Ruminococcaceae bacterium]|nr:trypsin-like serine protease [Oscillospiraceae bacterium]